MAYTRLLEIILDKKTIELVLLFHKNTTKLVFLWPNGGLSYWGNFFNAHNKKDKLEGKKQKLLIVIKMIN